MPSNNNLLTDALQLAGVGEDELGLKIHDDIVQGGIDFLHADNPNGTTIYLVLHKNHVLGAVYQKEIGHIWWVSSSAEKDTRVFSLESGAARLLLPLVDAALESLRPARP